MREHGADAYDFSHDKLREVAYAELSAARRQLLHRQVAQALEALHAADLAAVSQQVAAHYERAGMPDEAAPHYLRAAQVARRVYANSDAVALLKRGLAAIDYGRLQSVAAGRSLAAQLWEEMGAVLALTADQEAALDAYRRARELTAPEDRLGLARLYRRSGEAMREQRRYADALNACLRAEEALGTRPTSDAGAWLRERLDVQLDRVWALYWLADWPAMEELVHAVEPTLDQVGGAAARTRVLTAKCLMWLRRDRYVISEELVALAHESLSAAREWGDLKSIADQQFEVAFVHLWRRELAQAREALLAALELGEACGSPWVRALALTYLTVAHRLGGDVLATQATAPLAAQAASAAHMPDYVATASGNLAWVALRRGDLASAEEPRLRVPGGLAHVGAGLPLPLGRAVANAGCRHGAGPAARSLRACRGNDRTGAAAPAHPAGSGPDGGCGSPCARPER